jgi:hypothetical protein
MRLCRINTNAQFVCILNSAGSFAMSEQEQLGLSLVINSDWDNESVISLPLDCHLDVALATLQMWLLHTYPKEYARHCFWTAYAQAVGQQSKDWHPLVRVEHDRNKRLLAHLEDFGAVTEPPALVNSKDNSTATNVCKFVYLNICGIPIVHNDAAVPIYAQLMGCFERSQKKPPLDELLPQYQALLTKSSPAMALLLQVQSPDQFLLATPLSKREEDILHEFSAHFLINCDDAFAFVLPSAPKFVHQLVNWKAQSHLGNRAILAMLDLFIWRNELLAKVDKALGHLPPWDAIASHLRSQPNLQFDQLVRRFSDERDIAARVNVCVETLNALRKLKKPLDVNSFDLL